MRICHFTEILQGGPATYLNNLLPAQIARYGSNAVCVMAPKDQMSLLDADGADLVPLDYEGRRTVGRLLGLRRDFARAVREHGPFDIVHLHSSFAGLLGRSVALGASTAIVYCAHGWAFTMQTALWKKRAFALVERLLSMRAKALICISQSELEAAIATGMPASKCFLVRSGLADVERAMAEPHPDTDRLKLLFVGRFDRQKGFDLLLEAMRRLDDRVHLSVIGDHVVDAPVGLAVPLGVELLGWQSPTAVRSHIRSSHAVIMPSRWEGFGLVAVEAMREGRAVLAAKVGGLAEIVVDGETGLLFAPDDVFALERAISRSRDVDLADLGRKGRARFEALFTARRMADETMAIYERFTLRDPLRCEVGPRTGPTPGTRRSSQPVRGPVV